MTKAVFKRLTAVPMAEARRDRELEELYPFKETVCATYDKAERGEREAHIDSMYEKLTGEKRKHAKTTPIRAHIFGKSYDASLSKIRRHIFGGCAKGGE